MEIMVSKTPHRARRQGLARPSWWAAALIAAHCCWIASPASGDEVLIVAPVNDRAAVLTDAQEAAIESRLWALQEATGVQMAVLTVETTSGVPIEDFSLEAAERWKGGSKERDDGVLMTLAIEDRRLRLEVGYGLEGAVTDREASALLDAIAPHLRAKEYDAGILTVIAGVHEETKDLKPGAEVPSSVRAAGVVHRRATAVALFLLSALLGLILNPLDPWLPALSRKNKAPGPLGRLKAGASLKPLKTITAAAWSLMALLLLAVGTWKGEAMGAAFASGMGLTGMVAAHMQIKAHRTSLWRSFLALLVGGGLAATFNGVQDFWGEQALWVWFTASMMALVAYASVTAPKGSWASSGGSYSSTSSSRSSSSSSSSSSSYSGGGGSFGGGGASSSW